LNYSLLLSGVIVGNLSNIKKGLTSIGPMFHIFYKIIKSIPNIRNSCNEIFNYTKGKHKGHNQISIKIKV